MPIELQIIQASEFVRMNPRGIFDLAASKMALCELAHACHKRGIHQALIDLRALQPGPKPVFTPADLAELVDTFCEVGFTRRHRLAILYRTDPHRRARLFAFLSSMHGWAVQAFDDFEKALLWLSSGRGPGPRRGRSPGEKKIPVRFGKPKAKTRARRSKSLRSGLRRTLPAMEPRWNG
jgi:hypothetical protein